MRIWVGIDPGSAWTGYACVVRHKKQYTLQTCSISTSNGLHRITSILQKHFGLFDEGHVWAEDFKLRPLGHQQFNRGGTLRLLGSLEFVTRQEEFGWDLIQPGDIEGDLKGLGFVKWLKKWKKMWPSADRGQWGHAFSAWRVLGMGLVRNGNREDDKALLKVLRRPPKPHRSEYAVPALLPNPIDLTSPVITFTGKPRKKKK